MRHKCLLRASALAVILLLYAASAFALPYKLENDQIYGHKTLSGDLVFAATNNNPSNFFTSAQSDFALCKVFPKEGASYVYLYIASTDSAFKKSPAAQLRFIVNDREIACMPLKDVLTGPNDDEFHGWLKPAEPLEEILKNAQTMQIQFSDPAAADKVIKTIKINEKRFAVFARLAELTKEAYVREGEVFSEAKASLKGIHLMPQVFLPNVSPETVRNCVLDKIDTKAKEKNADDAYKIWRVWNDKDANPEILAVEGRESIDNSNAFITFITRPYQGGTLFTMQKNQKHYSSRYSSLHKLVSSSGFINMSGYWGSISDNWDALFLEVYGDLHGTSDYGFYWQFEKAKDSNKNTFLLKNINVAADQAGNEKTVTVAPAFTPAQPRQSLPESPPKKRKFVRDDRQEFVFDGSYTLMFEPLE